jgi:hypothetical protein
MWLSAACLVAQQCGGTLPTVCWAVGCVTIRVRAHTGCPVATVTPFLALMYFLAAAVFVPHECYLTHLEADVAVSHGGPCCFSWECPPTSWHAVILSYRLCRCALSV